METIWYDIPGYEGKYKINRKGEVLSLIGKEKKLKLTKGTNGYYFLQLRKNNKTYLHRIHKLLAIVFIPNPNNYSTVNHINNDKSDNRIENLEWISFRENVTHGFKYTNKTSKYSGVCYCKQTRKWKATCKNGKLNKTIGRYETEEKAREARLQYECENNINNKYS